jgi:hypothetical protein
LSKIRKRRFKGIIKILLSSVVNETVDAEATNVMAILNNLCFESVK